MTTSRRRDPVARVALRWPEEVAESLGVGTTWLSESKIAADARIYRDGKIMLVAVAELERVLAKHSAALSGE
jgi:hypothetical protein